MREILFRGKDLKGEWRYGTLLLATQKWCPHKKGGFHKEWIVGSSIANGGYINLMSRYPVKADTIGQYTGLVDKNGKPIFEDDIVRVICNNETYITRVVWVEARAGFMLRGEKCLASIVENMSEVIGNYHDII